MDLESNLLHGLFRFDASDTKKHSDEVDTIRRRVTAIHDKLKEQNEYYRFKSVVKVHNVPSKSLLYARIDRYG